MFRFTIRDVLWLMVVVALLVAWRFDHRAMDTSYRHWGELEMQYGKLLRENQNLQESLAFEREKYRAMIRPNEN